MTRCGLAGASPQRAQVFPDFVWVTETPLVHDQLESKRPDRWWTRLLEEITDQIELPGVAVLFRLPMLPAQKLPLVLDLRMLIKQRDQHRRTRSPEQARRQTTGDSSPSMHRILGSVSILLNDVIDGDEAAVQRIFERYYSRMVNLAQYKLKEAPRRTADEEDVALNAFQSFCVAASDGRFPQLSDRDNLWKLLATIVCRKAVKQIEFEMRQK